MRVAGLLLALVVVFAGAAGTGSAKVKKPRRAADLRVVVTGPSDPVLVGADVLYRVRVLNRGPHAARALVVRIDVPVALHGSTVGALTGGARCEAGGTPGPVRCTIPRLRARSAWALELVGSATAPGALRLVASVRSATRDPRLANNRATLLTPGSVSGPPPASAATPGGEVQMAVGSFCWTTGTAALCADKLAPTRESLAPLTAHPGDTVTFRLGFEATSAQLRAGAVAADLAASASPSWRVPDGFETAAAGLLVQLLVRAAGGDVSYWTRLIVPPAPQQPPAGPSTLRVPLLLASYCLGDHVTQPCLEPSRPPIESLEGVKVRGGDELAFDFKFAASDVELVVMKPTGEVVNQAFLPGGQSTTWRVPDGFAAPAPGVLVQLTISSELQYAVYFGRLVG